MIGQIIRLSKSEMEIKDLKILFDNGALITATITNQILDNGYIVIFEAKDKSKKYHISGQRTQGEPRVFKTIDAATRNAREIGFKNISISLP